MCWNRCVFVGVAMGLGQNVPSLSVFGGSAMCSMRGLFVRASLLVLFAAGCQRAVPPDTDVEVDGRSFRISGPHVHENVTVFLLHSADQDERDFLMLDEGLKGGAVKISEQQQERVNALE